MILIMVLMVSLTLQSANAADATPDHVMIKPTEMKWTKAPDSLPPGAEVSVLRGNPTEEGPFAMRLKLPANYKIPPHFHPADENITVISGQFMMGQGKQFDESKVSQLTTGSFASMKAKFPHFAMTGPEATEIQLHGIGPWGITYINPGDDPRKQKVKPRNP